MVALSSLTALGGWAQAFRLEAGGWHYLQAPRPRTPGRRPSVNGTRAPCARHSLAQRRSAACSARESRGTGVPASPGNEDRSRPWGGVRWRGRGGRRLGAGKAVHRHPAAGPPLPVATRVPCGEAGDHLGAEGSTEPGALGRVRGEVAPLCLCVPSSPSHKDSRDEATLVTASTLIAVSKRSHVLRSWGVRTQAEEHWGQQPGRPTRRSSQSPGTSTTHRPLHRRSSGGPCLVPPLRHPQRPDHSAQQPQSTQLSFTLN